MSILHTLLAALVVLGPLIAIHEFGHFGMARLLGVKVLVYSIGFGRGFVSWRDRQGTQYQITAIPLGGYVKFADEREGEVAPEDIPRAFNRQPVWKRFAIVAAGPLINILLGVVLYWFVFLQGVDTQSVVIGKILPNTTAAQVELRPGDEIVGIDHRPAEDWQAVTSGLIKRMGDSGTMALTVRSQNGAERTVNLTLDKYMREAGADPFKQLGFTLYEPDFDPVIAEVTKGGAGDQQGLQDGDRILEADGKPIKTWREFVSMVQPRAGKPLPVLVQHKDKQTVPLVLTPKAERDDSGQMVGRLGIMLDSSHFRLPAGMSHHISYGPVEALDKAVDRSWEVMVLIPESIGKMVSGRISTSNLSGPIGVAKVARESFDLGLVALLEFMAFYSVNLGILNLMPIPVLDGGHLVYYTIEALLRRPLSEQVQMAGLRVGLALLGSLMVFVIINDLSRLF